MLPAVEHVVAEPDEASILSSLFSNPLIDSNQITRRPSGVIGTEEAAPYDVAHYSAYDADTASDDQTRLLPHELMYEDNPLDRFNHSYTTRKCITKCITRKDGMPTIWQCVKNAFTMVPG
jgi:hypothetical protein